MMQRCTRIPLAVLCGGSLVFAATAKAQDSSIPARLTLNEALTIARERNPELAATREGVNAAAADRLGASRRPNPAVSIESEGYPLFERSRPAFLNNQELTVRVDQEFETAGRRKLRVGSAQAGVEVADATWRDAQRRLDAAVRQAYMQAALANADRETATESLTEIDKIVTVNRARLEQGEVSGADVRRLQVERLRFVDDVFSAELALRNARASLLTLLHAKDLGQPLEIADSLKPSPEDLRLVAAGADGAATAQLERLRTEALTNRPDLRAARAAQTQADTETRLQRALRTPNITFGGGYKRDLVTNAVVFGVTVPLPLFNRNEGGIARAEAERRAATFRLSATEAALALDVQQAVNAVDINRSRVGYIEREYLTAADESLQIVRTSYQLGATDLIDLLDAQRAFRETRRSYNRALYDLRISLFQLQTATGAPAVQP